MPAFFRRWLGAAWEARPRGECGDGLQSVQRGHHPFMPLLLEVGKAHCLRMVWELAPASANTHLFRLQF